MRLSMQHNILTAEYRLYRNTETGDVRTLFVNIIEITSEDHYRALLDHGILESIAAAVAHRIITINLKG